jgi:hypothetical protein
VSKRPREPWPLCEWLHRGRACGTIVKSTRDPLTGRAQPDGMYCEFHAVKAACEAADAASTQPGPSKPVRDSSSRPANSPSARVISSGAILEDGTEVADPEPVAA